MKKSAVLVLALLCGFAGAQEINCDAFTQRPHIYVGPDNQILAASQFPRTPKYPDKETAAYLKRFAEAVRRRGTLPVVAIAPAGGFSFVGRLDPKVIKGTMFEDIASPENLPKLQSAYDRTLQRFSDLGFVTPNLMNGMLGWQKEHPNASMYFLHDGHWNTNGAEAAALTVANTLKKTAPELVKGIASEELQVITTKVIDRTSKSGFDGLIQQLCPAHELFKERFPVLELQNVAGTAQPGLLDDDAATVVLTGDSYTSPSPEFGFALHLSSALSTRVLNAALSGSGALGSILQYYMTADLTQPEPKILVWEFINSVIANPEASNAMVPLTMRQVLPAVEKVNSLVEKYSIPDLAGNPITQLASAQAEGNNYFLNIKLSAFKTRKLNVTLNYAKGSEELLLEHSHGDVLDRYMIELEPKLGLLQSVSIAADGLTGSADLELRQYVK